MRLELILFVAVARKPMVNKNTSGISRVRVPAPERPVDAARPFAQVVYQAAEPLPVLLCLQMGAKLAHPDGSDSPFLHISPVFIPRCRQVRGIICCREP